MMDPQRAIQTLLDLCRIPSPSGQEGRVAAYVRTRATQLGLEVEEDNAGQVLGSDTGNLLVHVPGRGEPLFFCAHLDTVVPADLAEIPIIQDDDCIHTGGASILGYDDKGGVAAMLELAEIAVSHNGRARPLELLFTIQEERGLRGSRVFDADRLKARSGFVLDNESKVGNAPSAQPTKINFTIDVHGKAAHAAIAPDRGINAIKALGAVINELPTGKIDVGTVMNLGKVEGGGAVNVVPDLATLAGELRGFNEQKLQAMLTQIQHTAEQKAGDYNAIANFRWEILYTMYRISPESSCVQLFTAACRAEGYEAHFVDTLGGSDANNLNQKGLVCLNIGMDMNNIHRPDEFMRPSQFVKALRLLERIINLHS